MRLSERVWLVLALVVVLAGFGDMLVQGRTFVGFDHAIEYFPTWVFQRASLLRGELPLWDPRANCGTPLLAAIYGGALDPVRWLFYPLPAVLGYTLHAVALHLLAAAGAFRLARALGARPWVAAVGAILLGSGGPLRSLGGFEKELASSAWVPWVLLVAVAFARAPRLATALAGGALVALMVLAGGPEYALAAGVLLFCTAVWRVGVELRRDGFRDVTQTRPIGLVVLAGLAAFVLSAGVLLPGVELARISTRQSGVVLGQVYAHATHPLELATLVLPGIFGNSAHEWRTLGMVLFPQSYFMPVLYPGLLVVLLVPFAPWKRSRAARGLGLVALLAVVFALGQKGGLFWLLMETCPPLRVFRYAYKAWSFAAPALAVLAAVGLERVLVEGVSPRARRVLGGVVLVAALVGVVGGAAWAFPEVRARVQVSFVPGEPPELAAITKDELLEAAKALSADGALLALFAAALATLGDVDDRRRERLLVAFAVAGVLELTLAARAATPTIEASFYEKPPVLAKFFEARPGEAPPRFEPATRHDPLPRAFERSYGDDYWEFDKERLRANLATVWGLEQLHDYDPGKLALWNKAEWKLETATALERTHLLVNLGVELVISRAPLANPWLELVATTESRPRQYLYRFRATLPRYQVVAETRTQPRHESALDDMKRTLFLRSLETRADGATLEPEDGEPLPAPGPLPSLSLAPGETSEDVVRSAVAAIGSEARGARVVSYAPRRVELELREPAREGDWLLARDTWEPRWRASVDGKEAPVVRADFVFRAVKLPAGARHVVFEYDASLAHLAFALQALGWVVVAGALVIVRRRERGGAPAAPVGSAAASPPESPPA